MEQGDVSQSSGVAFVDLTEDLRHVRRTSVQCRLTYSGISSEALIIGEGKVVDLSTAGCGIEGNQPVEAGMKLTLCLQLPGKDQPLRINEGKVIWAKGSRFGVKSVEVGIREQQRLENFVQSKLDGDERNTSNPVSFKLPLDKVQAID